MCGVAGFLEAQDSRHNNFSQVLESMATTIISRGPDDSGVWCDEEKGIGLAHRRLSIVDLSAAGHQPMSSGDNRYAIVFNGEIYNHMQLRAELEGGDQSPQWRGHSDTETLLMAIVVWGVEAALQRCIGMFAFALWDKQSSTLTLARDRIGEKPLYYGWQGNTFLFGSELKALKAHPAFQAEIDRDALSLYMRYGYVPAPHSIYQHIFKLTPGCYLEVSARQIDPVIKSYWSAKKAAVGGMSNPFKKGKEELITDLEGLLFDAVGQQMIADVPLGAFLSGGIDSSTVVALMQAQSSQPIQTFSIGFHDDRYNEADHAKKVAQYLGTTHTELYVSGEDSMAVIPMLPTMFDEPFADSSQIPTFLVSQLARQQVTVSLSGDGGDELFAGYSRYQFAASTWNKLSNIPHPLRKFMASGISRIPPSQWDKVTSALQALHLAPSSLKSMGDKLHKGADVLGSSSVDVLNLELASLWNDPSSVVIGAKEPISMLMDESMDLSGLNEVERMTLRDLLCYLPDDILCKVDRSAMAVSLESRAPLLDHRVVEFAWKLPMEYKVRDGQLKWILRQVLYRHVPKDLIERPKMGFSVPIDSWLRGPLKEWAEDLLDESRLKEDGYFDPSLVMQKWQEHQSGRRNWQHALWNVLIFNDWLRKGDAVS